MKLTTHVSLTSLFLTGVLLLFACTSQTTALPPLTPTVETQAGLPAPTTAPAATDTPATQETGTLTVFGWSGYESPNYFEPFTQEYPAVQVEYSFFAEDAEAFAKAQSGFAYDVIHPCNEYWKLYVDNGLVQEIDTTRLTNWNDLYPKLQKLGEFNGKQYFVPWDWGYESILVRKDKVQEMPDSWADLWDTQYAGHVSLFDGGEQNHIITALALGLDPWNTTPEQNAEIQQKLVSIKPGLLTYWSDYTQINQLVASGDVWLAANAWNDAFLTLYREGVPVEYIKPKEGRLGWVCGYAISTASQNTDLAYRFIDALIAPQSLANMSNDFGNGVANLKAVPLINPEASALLELEKPDVLDATIFYRPITDQQRQHFADMWSEVKAAP